MSVYSFCHWVSLIELSSRFNINPYSFENRYSPWRWGSSWRSSWFYFSLGSACKSKYFRLRCGGLLLVVVVLPVDQVCDQFVQAMRNSDPRVRNVFVNRFNSDFHSMFTLPVTGCDFRCGSTFGVSLESNLSGQLICRLVVNFSHDMPLALHIVRTRQYFMSWSIVRLWLWKLFHSFFVLLQKIFLCGNFNRLCGCHYQ